MQLTIKDYVTINDKYFFAVVCEAQEDSRVLTFLRYIKNRKAIHKLDTKEADHYIKEFFPEFVFHSKCADVKLHGIPTKYLGKVYHAKDTVSKLLNLTRPDQKQQDAIKVINIIIKNKIDSSFLGITGSIMLGVHNQKSDIDMIVYGQKNFDKVINIIKTHVSLGYLHNLKLNNWQKTWQRRNCELSLDEYIYYEKRKNNKFICGNSVVDISLLPFNREKVSEQGSYIKKSKQKIIANVIDDSYAFHFPARFYIDNENINEVLVYTATYIGQAKKGEKIEVSAYLEENKSGHKRLVVGTNREAQGEYIRVLK